MQEAQKLLNRFKKKKITARQLIAKTHADSPEHLEKSIENILSTQRRYDRLMQIVPMTEKDFSILRTFFLKQFAKNFCIE